MHTCIVSHEAHYTDGFGGELELLYFVISRNLNCMFRCIVSHEAPYTGGFGGELAASIQVEFHHYQMSGSEFLFLCVGRADLAPSFISVSLIIHKKS